MPRIALGTHVEVGGLRGVVVRHSPKGMIDIRPDGEDFVMRKREVDARRLNPGKGSPPLRVRREVEKMLHNPPSSWRALYKRAGLPARPSVEDFIDIVRSKTPSGRSAEAHYGREMGKGEHVPTKAVRQAALLGLKLSYDNNYTSQSGVGLARAVQLVLDPSIDDLAKTRMRAYLTRHEKDKQGKNFGNLDRPSNGYMAWLNWGGDPAKEWLGMRNNPAGRKPDVMKKQDAQFQAVVQGIYETLMAKRLGEKDLYMPRGGRRDLIALREGRLTQGEVRDTLSRAFAIATRQGQKYGYLRPGSQEPTGKGRRRAYARFKDRDLRAQNAQDYEITLAMARQSSPLRVIQKGRGKSKKFFVQPHVEGVSKRGYKTQRGAVNAIERVTGLRMNPGPLDDMVADLDGDPNTVSLGELWDDFDEWVESSPERRLASGSRDNAELINYLKSMYRKRGMTPLEADKATAEEFIQHYNRYRGVFAPQMRKAVVGIVRKLDPTLLRRTLQTTSEEKARERQVERAKREGARVIPRVVGQSEVEGPAFAAGVRSGRQEAERRKAGKAKGKIKAGIGRAGVGIGALSRRGGSAEDRTFTAPVGFDGVEYPSVIVPSDDGSPSSVIDDFITYKLAKNGNMTLFFGGKQLPLNIPNAVLDRVYASSSEKDANDIMSLMGKTPLGIQPMTMENGKIVYDPIKPAEVQSLLNDNPRKNFKALAKYISENGFEEKERVEEYVRPRIDFAKVTVFDERLGKASEVDTYVIHGVGGDVRRIQNAIQRSQPRRKTWTSWKDAGARFSDPKGTWNTRGAHRTVGKRNQWYIIGPLVGDGYSPRDNKAYMKALRRFANLPPKVQEKMSGDWGTITPKRFTFKTKTAAEAVRKRLDKKLGKKRAPLESVPGYYGFYIRPEKQGDDGGYEAAVALAEELGIDGPAFMSPTARRGQSVRLKAGRERSMSAPQREEVSLSMGAAERSLSRRRLVEETKDKYNEIGQRYVNALETARNQNDRSEINRLSGINERFKQVRRGIGLLNRLERDPATFDDLLDRIYEELDDIEDTL